MQPPLYTTLSELHAAVRAGETTFTAVVEAYLQRIAQHRHLNAFLEVFPEEARATAAQLDTAFAEGTAGPLAGLVLGVKDNIVYAGHRVSAASKMLEGFESLFTATALQRCIDAGAIVIGRLNCDEFAMGSSNENSAFGPVRNPWNPAHVPGGSSGGSAAAVAAQLCQAALGSDTGGSIRQPAAFCGVFGLKPTYGRISRYGLIAYGSSMDQIGPLTHSAEDAAVLLHVMAGHDPHDNTSANTPTTDYPTETTAAPKPLRIGVIAEALHLEGLDEEVRERTLEALEKLRADGHTVEEVEFPYLDYLVPTYYVLSTAEASSNLARYDGVRYGYRAQGVESPEELYRRSRNEGFGNEVQRRIMLGTFVLSAGHYEEHYGKAQQVRRVLLEATQQLLTNYDLLLSPTTPSPAFALNAKTSDPVAMYLSDIFTVHANLVGMPAISFPYGLSSNGLPIGLHALAGPFREGLLLQFARQVAQPQPLTPLAA